MPKAPILRLSTTRLPQQGLSIDAVADHRARRAERRAEGTDESGEVSGVRLGGKNRNRGDAGRWRRARRRVGLDPIERKQVKQQQQQQHLSITTTT